MLPGLLRAEAEIQGTVGATINGAAKEFYVVVAPEIGPLGTFEDFVLDGTLQFTLFAFPNPNDLTEGEILSLQFLVSGFADGGGELFESQGTGFQPNREPAYPLYRDELGETRISATSFSVNGDRARLILDFESSLWRFVDPETKDESAQRMEVVGTVDVEFRRK